MKPKLPATQKEIISLHIKKGADISDLIKNYDIRGEDFSGAIIEHMDRPDEDISGCNFSQATIGKAGGVINWSRTVARNCNFRNTQFPCTIWLRRADLRNSSFSGAFIPYADYRYGDFRGCEFCHTVFSVGTNKALGSKFDFAFFKDMAKQWGIGILPQNEYDDYLKWKETKK